MTAGVNNSGVCRVLSRSLLSEVISQGREVLPYLDDAYELELAFYEDKLLSDEEISRNSAYFAYVNGSFTRHFLMCAGDSLRLPEYSSSRLKSFFQINQFRTGYGTHGLFPYRGKFHPQMIKALMNIMGLKSGHKVLDPMVGSGTVLVEATLMGIDSIGVDASPFCRFMAQTKVDALTMSLERARNVLKNYKETFEYFKNKVGKPCAGTKVRRTRGSSRFLNIMESGARYLSAHDNRNLNGQEKDTFDTFNFLLLAYLDSAGYSERSTRRSPLDQFKAILERYLFVAEKIQDVLKGFQTKLGSALVLQGDARTLPLHDRSVDGIIFSPPYSFAIDYLDNDSFHLQYLGVDIKELRHVMVGLRGRSLPERFELYQHDMDKVMAECARVIRPDGICTIIVGTNNNQLSKILEVPPDEVRGIHEILSEQAVRHGFRHLRTINRPITGIANTMRREYIVMMMRS